MTSISHDRLLIIDFGSQVTQLIARRLRELNVYCEIHPYQNVTPAFLTDFAPRAVILSGGPASVTREEAPAVVDAACDALQRLTGLHYGRTPVAWRQWWAEARDQSPEEWLSHVVEQLSRRRTGYLDEGEHARSTLDVERGEHLRQVGLAR